jgi:hypothetical protein
LGRSQAFGTQTVYREIAPHDRAAFQGALLGQFFEATIASLFVSEDTKNDAQFVK